MRVSGRCGHLVASDDFEAARVEGAVGRLRDLAWCRFGRWVDLGEEGEEGLLLDRLAAEVGAVVHGDPHVVLATGLTGGLRHVLDHDGGLGVVLGPEDVLDDGGGGGEEEGLLVVDPGCRDEGGGLGCGEVQVDSAGRAHKVAGVVVDNGVTGLGVPYGRVGHLHGGDEDLLRLLAFEGVQGDRGGRVVGVLHHVVD